ncbi:MAG: hypothetical protein D6681_15270 [Calditrichaeota bacterium]|nr:MAG: hypothetical protein D6681_15270 [Calditrichota bacterium]
MKLQANALSVSLAVVLLIYLLIGIGEGSLGSPGHLLKDVLLRALVPLYVGWTLTYLLLRFKEILAPVLVLTIIFNLILLKSGIVEVFWHWQRLQELLHLGGILLAKLGMIAIIGMLLGIWSGYVAFQGASR